MSAFRCPQCGRVGSYGETPRVRCSCGYRCDADCLEANAVAAQIRRTREAPEFPCIHRGRSLGVLDCGCAGNSTVYSCSMHGECMPRKLKPSRGPDATCSVCEDRDAPSNYAAIITTHFNPAGRQRLRDTYHQWAAAIGYPFQCYELAFGEPEIPGSIAIRGDASKNSIWQKERLTNIAISRLPASVRYVAWVDHDLLFANPDWLEIGCEMIRGGCQAVQLFSGLKYLGRDGSVINRARGSVAAIQATGELSNSNPGGAWIASREWLDNIGGLYDRNICGGGDATFFQAVSGARCGYIDRQAPKLRDDCLAYVARVGGATIGYVPGIARHIWHGDRANRQYRSRDEIMCRHDFDPARHLQIAENGLLELSNAPAGLADDIARYFADRRDDG